MFEFEIRGLLELRAAAAQLRIEDKKLRSGATRALLRGVRGLRKTIPAAAKRLPSGYAPVMAEDVQVTASVKLAAKDPTIAVKVWAEGAPAKGHRDVENIDAGNLRHPLFGRRKKDWYDQAVKTGFASDPFQEARPDILREIEQDWNDMVTRVERG